MHRYRLAILLAITLPIPLAATGNAHAQNRALDLSHNHDVDLSPGMRENLETIGRYADTVNRRLAGQNADNAPSSAKRKRFEQIADPFEVSPQLRENDGNGAAFNGLPSAGRLELQRQIQVKAILVTARGKVAQLAIRDQNITVMDGELVDLGSLGTFAIHIERDSVTFSNPGAPQATKLILR